MTRASAAAFWLVLTMIVSLGLYHTSYRVDDMEQKLHALNKKIKLEQRTIHVLKAEWNFLSNPARIEMAARKHLDLQPTAPKQITKLRKLASLLPTHKEAMRRTRRTHRAVARIRPAAGTPKASSYELGRLNTRVTFKKTAHSTRQALPWTRRSAYTLANSGSTP